ncbi:hypothetical protein ACTQ49_08255 [Luteococcus sp. Sow4_B9]|uniref:hypothetical protein n=1 Tax=Luteococcus sp. Sow4_B9 TaxID=3438792 RepID=UPI003F977178
MSQNPPPAPGPLPPGQRSEGRVPEGVGGGAFGGEQAADPSRPFDPGYVVGFNPVPMAHAVAQLGSRLRSSILWTVIGAAIWTAVWWWQRENWGSPWLLVAGYAISIVLIVVTAIRLLLARRNLARIGRGPALQAGREGLRLHTLEGAVLDIEWDDVKALRAAGLKVGAGPELVVEARQGKVWSMPLSFLDALPGTIDGGVRATSAGRHGLDLSGLDSIF